MQLSKRTQFQINAKCQTPNHAASKVRALI